MRSLPTSRPVALLTALFFSLSALLSQGSSVTAQPLAAGDTSTSPQSLTKVEVPSLRTATSRTYRQGNSYEAQLYAAPVNFKDAHGQFQPIDDSLVPSSTPAYAHENHANRYTVRFPTDIATQPIRLESGSAWLTFRPRGLSGPGSASGETQTYTGSNYSIAYLAAADALKETITLQNASAPTTVVYDIAMSPGLTARSTTEGRIELVDSAGVVQFAFERPSMMDASGPASLSLAVSAALATTSGRTTLTLTVDPSWLTAPGRQFPVTIDPTIPILGSNLNEDRECPIISIYPTNTYCTYPDLYAGYDRTIYRSLLHFDLSTIPRDANVYLSQLWVYLADSAHSTTATTINMDPMTQPAWTTTATWNAYNGTNSWATPGGDFLNSPADSITIPQNAPASWQQWDIPSLTQNWVNGTTANDGIEMVATTESIQNMMLFYDANAGSAYTPYLVVRYAFRTGIQSWDTINTYGVSDQISAGVNVTNGNLIVHQSNVAMAGRGMPLSVGSYYNSLNSSLCSQDMGYGWSSTVGPDVGLLDQGTISDDSIMAQGPSGDANWFYRDDGGTFTTPPGVDATLVKNADGSFTLTDHASQHKVNFINNSPVSELDRSGNTLSYTYNTTGNHNLATLTDTQGRTTSFTYSGGTTGTLTQIQDPAGRLYGFGYTGCDLTSYTDATNHTAYFAYGTGTDGNPLNAMTQITDPNGNATKFSYVTDGYGLPRVASVTRVLNGLTSYTWNYTYGNGFTSDTDPNNHTTTYYFDRQGKVTSTIDPMSHPTQMVWSGDNHASTVTDSIGYASQANYDANNNQTFSSAPTTSTSTNCNTVPTPTTCITSRSVYPTTGTGNQIYNPTSSTDAQGNTSSYQYNTQGLVTQVAQPVTSTTTAYTKFGYNSDGTLAMRTDPNNHILYSYYTNGLLTSTKDALSRTTAYTYNSYNLVQTKIDPKGQTWTYTYDSDGRVTNVAYTNSNGTSAGSVGYGYDGDGNVISMTDGTGTTSYYFDALNRETEKLLPGGQAITYTYDGVGNMLTQTDAGGQVTYVYNPDDTLQYLTDPSGTVNFTYDNDARRTGIAFPSGVTEHISYNGDGQLTQIWATGCTSGTCPSFTYSYTIGSNATGLRSCVTNATGAVTKYSYDKANRILSAANAASCTGNATSTPYSYGYDLTGNITSTVRNGTSTTLTYDAANEMTTSSGTTFSYDLNGNQSATTSGYSMQYNAANQTTSITPPSSGATVLSYAGQGQAERLSRGTDVFQNSGNGIDVSSIGGSAAYYTRTPDGNIIDERIPGGSSAGTYDYLVDGLNSVVALTTSSGGIANTYSYEPYGVPTQTGSVPNPYEWISGVYDSFTGWYKLGERYYRPVVGSFTQGDPGACAATNNPYWYGDDAPVTMVDPTGLFSFPNPFGFIRDWACKSCVGIIKAYDLAAKAEHVGCEAAVFAACILVHTIHIGHPALEECHHVAHAVCSSVSLPEAPEVICHLLHICP